MDPTTVVTQLGTYGRGKLDEPWRKFLAENISVHAPPPTMELDRESWRAAEKAFFAAFDDIDVKVIDQLAEGDKVATRWSITARQAAELYGVPSRGRTATVTGTYIDVARDDKIGRTLIRNEPAAVHASAQRRADGPGPTTRSAGRADCVPRLRFARVSVSSPAGDGPVTTATDSCAVQ